MKTRYAIPVTVAMIVHGLLLFGFNRTRAATRPEPPPANPAAEPMILVFDDAVAADSDPEEAVSASDDRSSSPAPPDLPDRILAPTPSDFVIAVSPLGASATPRWNVIPPGLPSWSDRAGPGGNHHWVDAKLLDRPPHATVQVAPEYPLGARREGLNGEVVVRFDVDEAGRVIQPRVVRSSSPVFEEATLRAVVHWRFEPGRRNGRVVRFRMAVPVEFGLER